MINSEKVNDTYTGDGTSTEYAVTYPFYEATDLSVYVSINGIEEQKTLSSDYTVTVNDDHSGGYVIFQSLDYVPKGCTIAILLNLPLLQELDLKASATVDTESTEQQFDKIVQMIQQLNEKLQRAVTVPATQAALGDVDVTAIYDAADRAAASAAAAKLSENVVNAQLDTFRRYVDDYVESAQAKIKETYADCEARLNELCQSCMEKIQNLVNLEALARSLSCIEVAWTLDEDVESGSTLTIPGGFQYIVGVRHLRLAYSGVDLSPTWYSEVGSEWTLSSQVIVNLNLRAGQEVHAWCCPLGSSEVAETAAKVADLQDQLTDLSRRVVYSDSTGTGD